MASLGIVLGAAGFDSETGETARWSKCSGGIFPLFYRKCWFAMTQRHGNSAAKSSRADSFSRGRISPEQPDLISKIMT